MFTLAGKYINTEILRFSQKQVCLKVGKVVTKERCY